ncbi:MAG TPA: hypothetical protein VFL55_14845 [Acetobacteraceae bacterium]|nr:hypothetical protein [Acetobacteraceae bacterium]
MNAVLRLWEQMGSRAIIWLFALLLPLAGCSTYYAALPLRPDNCGTPYRYKSCIQPQAPQQPDVASWQLASPSY